MTGTPDVGGAFRAPDGSHLHDGLPLAFLAGDLRHLPPLHRPGPWLRRAARDHAEGRRLPRRARRAVDTHRQVAEGFWRQDDRIVALAVAWVTDPHPSRSGAATVARYLRQHPDQPTTSEVVASAMAERRDAARSFNAYVDQLEDRARRAYQRRLASRAGALLGTLTMLASAAVALPG